MMKTNDGPCPVCGSTMTWDLEDERYECRGVVQHCFELKLELELEGEGARRQVRLVASGSGEDAELFSTYPWPEP